VSIFHEEGKCGSLDHRKKFLPQYLLVKVGAYDIFDELTAIRIPVYIVHRAYVIRE
jgi:hypothetical protein